MPWCSQRELNRLDRLLDDYKERAVKAEERLERVERVSAYYVRHFANQMLKARKSSVMENVPPDELKLPPKVEPPPTIEAADLGEWNALIADQLDANPEMSLNQAEAAVRKILETEGKMAPV